MKYSELQEPIRKQHINYIKERWTQLIEIVQDTANQSIKYLYVSNSGAAAGVLTFLGIFAELRTHAWPRWMLILFLSGVLLVGLYWAARYHSLQSLFKGFRNDAVSSLKDEVDVEEVESRDWGRVNKLWLPTLLAYASFLCFIAGLVIGACNLLN